MVSDAFPERNSQFKIHVIGQDLDYFFSPKCITLCWNILIIICHPSSMAFVNEENCHLQTVDRDTQYI